MKTQQSTATTDVLSTEATTPPTTTTSLSTSPTRTTTVHSSSSASAAPQTVTATDKTSPRTTEVTSTVTPRSSSQATTTANKSTTLASTTSRPSTPTTETTMETTSGEVDTTSTNDESNSETTEGTNVTTVIVTGTDFTTDNSGLLNFTTNSGGNSFTSGYSGDTTVDSTTDVFWSSDPQSSTSGASGDISGGTDQTTEILTEELSTTLDTNINCVVNSSSLNISSIEAAPSQIMGDTFVQATLENTGECGLLTWNIDGTESDGGRVKRETLANGQHTVCCSVGTQPLGCGYVEVVSDVAWSNTCDKINVTVGENDALIMTTPLPPSENVQFQWNCSRPDSSDCYTIAGKFMTMYGTVSFSPVIAFLNGFGVYDIIANVTDPDTGAWSCRRYLVTVADKALSTSTIVATGETTAMDHISFSTGVSTDVEVSTDIEWDTTITFEEVDVTVIVGEVDTTLIETDLFTSPAEARMTTSLGKNSVDLKQGAPTEITTNQTGVAVSIESTGDCVILVWNVDGASFDGGTTSISLTLAPGDHSVCYSLGFQSLGCGYIRVLTRLVFTNQCEQANVTIHPNDSLVVSPPATPSSDVQFSWQCIKGGSSNCYTPAARFMTMQNLVTMSPAGAFMNGIGVYAMIANATDPVSGQWSCRNFTVNIIDWPFDSSSTSLTRVENGMGTTAVFFDGSTSDYSDFQGSAAVSSEGDTTLVENDLLSTESSALFTGLSDGSLTTATSSNQGMSTAISDDQSSTAADKARGQNDSSATGTGTSDPSGATTNVDGLLGGGGSGTNKSSTSFDKSGLGTSIGKAEEASTEQFFATTSLTGTGESLGDTGNNTGLGTDSKSAEGTADNTQITSDTGQADGSNQTSDNGDTDGMSTSAGSGSGKSSSWDGPATATGDGRQQTAATLEETSTGRDGTGDGGIGRTESDGSSSINGSDGGTGGGSSGSTSSGNNKATGMYTSTTPSISPTTSISTTTNIPATIPPELQQKIDFIMTSLQSITNPQEIKTMCAQNTSDIAQQYSNLTDSQAKQIANGADEGSLQTERNTTGQEVVAAIQKSMSCVNNELASQMQEVIASISALPIESATGLNAILQTLMAVLNGSTSSILQGSGANGLQSVQGTFVVLYGTIKAGNYELTSLRSAVRIIGSDAYITGDIRPAKIQSDTASLLYSGMDQLGVKGMFGSIQVAKVAGPSTARALNGKRVYCRMDGSAAFPDVDGPSDMSLTYWNVTIDTLGDQEQEQTATAVSFSLTVQSGSIQMNGADKDNLGIANATSLSLVVNYNGMPYTLTLGNGTAQILESRGSECILQYDFAKITVDVPGTDLDNLQLPVVLENVDCSSLASATDAAPFSLRVGNGSHPMAMVAPYPGTYNPSVYPITSSLTNIILPFGEGGTPDQLSQKLAQGLPALITGKITTLAGTITLANPDTVQYTGSYLMFTWGANKTRTNLNSPTYAVNKVNGKTCLVISAAKYQNPTETHIMTQVEVSTDATIYLTGGTIIRNGTHGYVISNAKINYTGILPPGSVDLDVQSLLNQDSQSLVIGILKDTANYLRASGSQMTTGELNDTAASLLTMSGQIINTMINSLNNPLSSDLLKNLQYEKDNYNSIFNVLPRDPGNIRYVEEYTEQEWAQQATLIAQQNIARQMANQLKDTMDALGDAIASKYLTSAPYNVAISTGGGTVVEAGGNQANLFSQTYNCNNWTVQFPPFLTDLNVFDPGPTDTFRVSMFCFQENPYAYASNYPSLITSGTLDLSLKTVNADVIPVNGATKPINITGLSTGTVDYGTEIVEDVFTEIQVLDVKTFHTTAWNYSINLEVTPDANVVLPAGALIYVFVSFQGLPGPMPKDHDFRFLLNHTNDINQLFIDGQELTNSSGLYYVGIGVRMAEEDSTTVNYTINDEKWPFSKEILFAYSIRALSKGCYFFNIALDRFDSSNITVPFFIGDSRVGCNSYHLTTFSIGLFSPLIPVDFKYEYVMDVKPLVITPFFLAALVLAAIFYANIESEKNEKEDESCGALRHLADNRRGDSYVYVLSVETGHHMFSTTSSKIMFNLIGTEAQAVGRSFVSEEDNYWEKPFQWGRVARFIMTTRWPLGDLKFFRLWIHEPGVDHAESWFCSRVIIKDLQTNERFYFPVKNWLGSNAGDGKTERLAKAVPRDKSIKAALSCQLWCENISYISCITGGGGMRRFRVPREIELITLFAVLVTVLFLNCILLFSAVYNRPPQKILGYECDYIDLIYAVTTGFVITIGLAIPQYFMKKVLLLTLAQLCRDMRGFYEMSLVHYYRLRNKNFKIPIPDKASFVTFIYMAVLYFCCMINSCLLCIYATGMAQDNACAFIRRVGIGLALWIFVFEPIKAFIWSWSIVRRSPDHNIIFPVEQALLPVLPIEQFQKADPMLRDETVGTSFADMCQLEITRSARVREDRLFHTMKEVLLLLAAMIIFMGLSSSSKDANGFFYQTQLRTMLNVDPPSKDLPFDRTLSFLEIKNSEDFWNWANDSLANGIRVSWYDGQPAWDMRGFMNDKVSRAMGNGVIRQIRSPPLPCKSYFGANLVVCLYDIDVSGILQGSYGSQWSNSSRTLDEYSYKSGAALMNQPLEGEFFSYEGGGFTIGLDGSTEQLQEKLTAMKEQGWMDQFTRAVVVEFSVYNAQINYFAVVQLMLEMPKGRVFLPSAWIEPLRLIKYEGSTGTVTMIFEILFICYALVMFVKEFVFYIYIRWQQIKKSKFGKNPILWPYYILLSELSFWDILNVLIGFLSAGTIMAFVLRNIFVDQALALFQANNGNTYMALSTQRTVEMAFNMCYAGVVFFISCKMIKILRFNRRIAILADTLDAAGTDIVNFGISFLLCCCAFNTALFGLLWYELEGYRTAVATAQTTIAAMLGKFIITDIYGISTLASIFFVCYLLTGTIVLLNIYVMIIMTWFEEVRNDPTRQANDYELLEQIQTKLKRQMGLFDREDRPAMAFPNAENESSEINRYMSKIYLTLHLALMAKEDKERRGRQLYHGKVYLGKRNLKNLPVDRTS